MTVADADSHEDATVDTPVAGSGGSAANVARLETWERRTRPAIIAAAIIPLIGVTTGTKDYGVVGDVIEIACWLVFLVDLVVHMRLHPRYLRTGYGKFDLFVVLFTSPWYLLPGASGGAGVTILRLARLGRVAMVGFQTPVIRRTLDRLGRPFMYVGIVLMVCAAIVQRAEDDKQGFESYGDSLWWGVVTITTVGYGDIVPETRVGRLTATVLMLTGVAVLGTVAASLASMFRLEDKAEESAPGDRPVPASSAASPSESVDAAVSEDAPISVVAELRALREEVASLRAEMSRDPAVPSPRGPTDR